MVNVFRDPIPLIQLVSTPGDKITRDQSCRADVLHFRFSDSLGEDEVNPRNFVLIHHNA